ncbi:MAG: type VII secretion-associated protein [Mycobacterium sp.]
MTTVCEVGPGTIRLLNPETTCAAADPMAAVLAAGAEPVALLDGGPVATAELWRTVLAPLLAGAHDVLLVHPSWWAPERVGLVVRAAEGGPAVRPVSRRELLHPESAFVEIGPELVVIGDERGITGAETRCAEPAVVVSRVVERLTDGPVHVDAPAGVAGADALGALLARRLRENGRQVRLSNDRRLRAAALAAQKPAPPRRRLVRPVVRIVAAAAAVCVVAGLGIHAGENHAATTDLVEGRIAVRIPADWNVRRVTDGPGSARVEVASPADPDAVLYITQSRVRDTDLTATAAALRAALAGQQPGVFADFTADDRRAGRPVVTYREVRPGREIDWTVLISGGVRIAIGCQNASAACAEAIGSAREIG